MSNNIKKNKLLKLLYTLPLLLGVAGCMSVIRGQESATQYASGSTVTAKVKGTLIADSRVGADQIHVETKKGSTVILSGVVKNSQQKHDAVYLAKKVRGVEKVIDRLTLENEL